VVKVPLHSTGDASRLAALLIARLCSINSLFAPGDPGVSPVSVRRGTFTTGCYDVVETSATVMVNAADLATDHGLALWDSVVLAASAEADCRLLLSEDRQDGFTWSGVTVTNPFAATLHPLLASLLKSQDE
jgi:hypothetical protein